VQQTVYKLSLDQTPDFSFESGSHLALLVSRHLRPLPATHQKNYLTPVRYKYGSPYLSGYLDIDYSRWVLWYRARIEKDLKKRGKPIPDYLRPYVDWPPK